MTSLGSPFFPGFTTEAEEKSEARRQEPEAFAAGE
jgi:hypothetical protein